MQMLLEWSLLSAAGRESGQWESHSGPSSASAQTAAELTRTGLCMGRGDLKDQAPASMLVRLVLGFTRGYPISEIRESEVS